MIIGITGMHRDVNGAVQTIGAGKDAAADVLIAKHGFVRIGLADPLKRICMEVFDFTEEQLWGPSDRRNAPDFRHPRGGDSAANWRKKYEEAKVAYATGYTHQKADSAEMLQLKHEMADYASWGWLTPRYALQQLGTQWGRDCSDDVWINYGLRLAAQLLADPFTGYTAQAGFVKPCVTRNEIQGVVFSDVRFYNEYKAIKEAGGKIVRVKRFSWTAFPAHVDKTHESERQLPEYDDAKFDYIIDNGGDLHHLGLLVDRMLDTFKGRVIPYDESQKDIPPGLRKLPQ